MKIYANTTAQTLNKFIGKNLWVKVTDDPNNESGYHEWYIRPLSISKGRVTFNICSGSADDEAKEWEDFQLAQILKDRSISDVNKLFIIQPISILTTDEIIQSLYKGEFIAENEFKLPDYRKGFVEFYDFDTDELSYIQEKT